MLFLLLPWVTECFLRGNTDLKQYLVFAFYIMLYNQNFINNPYH